MSHPEPIECIAYFLRNIDAIAARTRQLLRSRRLPQSRMNSALHEGLLAVLRAMQRRARRGAAFGLRGESSLHYVYKAVRSAVVHLKKRLDRERVEFAATAAPLDDLVANGRDDSNPAVRAAHREALAGVRQALLALRPDLRVVVWLYYSGLEYWEIQALTGIPRDACYAKKREGVRQLRITLGVRSTASSGSSQRYDPANMRPALRVGAPAQVGVPAQERMHGSVRQDSRRVHRHPRVAR